MATSYFPPMHILSSHFSAISPPKTSYVCLPSNQPPARRGSSTCCVPSPHSLASTSASSPKNPVPWPSIPSFQTKASSLQCSEASQPPETPPIPLPPIPTSSSSSPLTLYPSSSPHLSGYLPVSPLHTLYYQVYGNPDGLPALFLHGGPGAGCFPNHARFFDPSVFRIVLFDQRGAGLSTPCGCLTGNSTADLTGDIEQLRVHLGVTHRWSLVLGGSWGVTLALAYAQAHPDRVGAMLLRGVCLLRPRELRWFFSAEGAASLFPFAWSEFTKSLPPPPPASGDTLDESKHVIGHYYKRLTSADATMRSNATSAWQRWEMALSSFPSPSAPSSLLVWDGSSYSYPASPFSPSPHPPSPAPTTATPNPAPTAQKHSPPPSLRTSPSPTPSPYTTANSASSPIPTPSPTSVSPSPPASPAPSQSPATPGVSKSPPPSPGQAAPSHSQSPVAASVPPPVGSQPAVNGAAAGTKQRQAENGAGVDLSGTDLQGGPHISRFAAQSRIECHYFHNNGFLSANQLLDSMEQIRHIPTVIVHGRYDFVCPLKNAIDLHKAWPEAQLRIVPNAGHSMYEAGITHELISCTDAFGMAINKTMCKS